jgi:hypothetical protein
MRFITKPETLHKLNLPFCLVPVFQTFAATDAIVLTEDSIITLQMTVSSKHDAKNVGFQKIFDGLPAKFLRPRTWRHVFLTDSEDKVKALRNQKLKKNDGTEVIDIHIYSAVINIHDWDLIITSDRTDELKEVAISRHWLYTVDIYW